MKPSFLQARPWVTLLLFLAALQLAAPLAADPKPSPEPESQDALRRPAAVSETPATISVVSEATLERRHASLLQEASLLVPGLHAESFADIHDLFFVRGLDTLSGGFVVDGTADPAALLHPLYNVDQVEVLHGPSFLELGTAGGALHLRRKRPLPGTLNKVRYSLGSHATQELVADVNHSRPDNSEGFRINAYWRASDGFREDTSSSFLALHPVFMFRPSHRTTVTWSIEGLRSRREPDAGLPLVNGRPADLRRSASFQPESDFSAQDVVRLRLDIETRFGPRLRLRNSTAYTVLDWQSSASFFTGSFAAATGEDLAEQATVLRDDRRRLVGHRIDLLYETEHGKVRHRLTTGVELSRRRHELGLSLAPAAELPTLPPRGTSSDQRVETLAPHILEELSVGRWRFDLGARADRIDHEDGALPDGLEGVEKRRQDTELSPFLGILFAPNEDHALYANYREAASVSTAGSAIRRADELRQIELGWRGRIADGRWRARLALFRLERDAVSWIDPAGPRSLPGEQRSEGIELEIGGDFGGGVSGRITASLTDAEIVRLELGGADFAEAPAIGARPAWVPEVLAGAWLEKSLFGDRFALGLGGRFVGERYADLTNRVRVGSDLHVDALVAFGRWRWRAVIQVRNLADARPVRRGLGAAVLPEDGIHVVGSLRVDL